MVVLAAAVAWWAQDAPTRDAFAPPDIVIERDVEYAPGSFLDVLRPTGTGPWPAAVLLHGCCGGRRDMFQLAHELASRDVVAYNADWQPISEGGSFPAVYAQAACAVRFARDRAAVDGGSGEVTLVAWSDGALVGATLALSDGDAFASGCASTASSRPDRFVGIAGFYGWSDPDRIASPQHLEGAERFFGGSPAAAPESWSLGNPYARLGGPVSPPMTLLVGADDSLVVDAACFDRALRAAGHPSTLTVVREAGHLEMVASRTPGGIAAVDLVVGVEPDPTWLDGPIESLDTCP
ncbi:MAG: hypothetical protein HKN41_02815 [Ilumatobacter sp.]|nr:hypothetical protein [Ilumatobacter sp.]